MSTWDRACTDAVVAARARMIDALPAGVAVTGLAAIMDRAPGALEEHLGHYAPADANGFAALNTAFMTDGAYIALAAGTVMTAVAMSRPPNPPASRPRFQP